MATAEGVNFCGKVGENATRSQPGCHFGHGMFGIDDAIDDVPNEVFFVQRVGVEEHRIIDAEAVGDVFPAPLDQTNGIPGMPRLPRFEVTFDADGMRFDDGVRAYAVLLNQFSCDPATEADFKNIATGFGNECRHRTH